MNPDFSVGGDTLEIINLLIMYGLAKLAIPDSW